MAERAKRRVTLVTGYPQYTTRRLVEKIARSEPTTAIHLLVAERALDQARRFVATLPGRKTRYKIWEGDVRKIDLGLSGDEWKSLSSKVNVIHHMAAVFHLGVDEKVAEEVNIRGTAEVVELALSAKHLERLVFYSTVGVSGRYRGVWTEDDLDKGQGFNNHYEETKFRAERLLRRECANLPWTVLRPSVLVGDSESGEVDRFDGPYQLMLLFIALPVDLGLILPGRAARLINLVPIDYFVEAASVIANHPEATRRAFHIVDPAPLPMSEVFNLVALASKRKVPMGYIPARITRAIMRTPGLERFADSPMAALDLFSSDVVFDSAGAQQVLAEEKVSCPPFRDYVETLVAFMRRKIEVEASRRQEAEVYDPLW